MVTVRDLYYEDSYLPHTKKLVVCSHECNQTYFIFVNITVFVYLLIIQSFYSDSQKFRAIITLQAIIAQWN